MNQLCRMNTKHQMEQWRLKMRKGTTLARFGARHSGKSSESLGRTRRQNQSQNLLAEKRNEGGGRKSVSESRCWDPAGGALAGQKESKPVDALTGERKNSRKNSWRKNDGASTSWDRTPSWLSLLAADRKQIGAQEKRIQLLHHNSVPKTNIPHMGHEKYLDFTLTQHLAKRRPQTWLAQQNECSDLAK
jgi:hypothetical protein